jgi:anti-sigma-K factor RskA
MPEVRRRASVAPWLAAAAALLLAAGLGTRWRAERTARGEAERLLADRTAALGARTAALAERDSLLAALLAPDVQTARLTATGAAPEVRVHWQRSRGVVVLTAQALPVPRPGRTYQLWGIPTGGAPQGLGTFQPAANGEARVVLRVPPGAAMDVAAITDEPSGGSPAPTTTPIVLGTFRSE